MKNENGKTLPEKKISTGAISATIWKNNGTSKSGIAVEYRTVQLDRRYKDKDGNWQSTASLRLNDLPKASLVLQKAYEYLVLKGQGAASSSGAPSGASESDYAEDEDIVF